MNEQAYQQDDVKKIQVDILQVILEFQIVRCLKGFIVSKDSFLYPICKN